MQQIRTDVLVVGGGTGGTAAAIQAARHRVKTVLVSEFPWLGGMLTAAGVCAPDGNELLAWQTGLWGAYLQELQQKQPGGLDNAWVSLFTYHPHIGAKIFADWVKSIPNLQWISGYKPLAITKQGDRITAVRFSNFIIEAKIIIDATELGDLLALGDVPHRWGWELPAEFNGAPAPYERHKPRRTAEMFEETSNIASSPSRAGTHPYEPSAPITQNELTANYPVQAPTWVFLLQDYGVENTAPHISGDLAFKDKFQNAWDNYSRESFLNYGKLTDNLYMINWPICGNDYGENLTRLIESETLAQQFLEEAYQHSYDFASYLQSQLGARYGLAREIFPHLKLDRAFALHPYYRESRRLQGKVTITENDILPVNKGRVAPLSVNKTGTINSIAIGNYANDHHYPGYDFQLKPKSIRWGGRWTGTPFTVPYEALYTESTPGLLVCEKNISVSHIANGSTRLQPIVMNIGQAAGMAAALCIELNCQPQELSVRMIQQALLCDPHAPAAIIPVFNLSPQAPDWLYWQTYYLDRPEVYPISGNCPVNRSSEQNLINDNKIYRGIFQRYGFQEYGITIPKTDRTWQLITIDPEIDRQLLDYPSANISVIGKINRSGNWLIVEKIIE